jgi:hypothetical protein
MGHNKTCLYCIVRSTITTTGAAGLTRAAADGADKNDEVHWRRKATFTKTKKEHMATMEYRSIIR